MTPCSSTLHQSTLDLPLSDEFIALITTHLAPLPDTCQGVILNFRDPEYSAENGGWHPVEIRLIRSERPEIWQLDHLIDSGWQGRVRPKLAKESDISWSQRYVWHCLIGELSVSRELSEFQTLWQDNFVAYCAMDVFTVAVSPNCWGGFMLFTLTSRLVIYRPLSNLAESFTDNVARDTVDEPAKGGIVQCELAGGYVTHSGIYTGSNRIVHLFGNGEVLCSDRKGFMARLNSPNPTMSVYTDCQGRLPVGNIAVAGRTLRVSDSRRQYHLLKENCHRLTAECLTGRPDNAVVLHHQLKRLQRRNT